MSKDILRDLRGFGTVEKWILTDPKLHASAKGLYALLCAYAGDKGQAFPGTDLLRHQMGLSKNTLHKYIKQLEGFGVIKVDQLRTDGKFSRNIYTLLPQGYAASQKLGTHKMSSQKMGSQDLDANNNSLKNNSLKNNSLKSNRLNNAPADLKLLLERNIDEQLANDFLQVRKAKRAPLTLTAIEGLEREAGKANLSFEQVIRLCVERGWQGFSASWSIPSNAPAVNDFNSQDYGKPVIPNFRKK